MITDRIPRKTQYQQEYLRSDGMRIIELPPAELLRVYALRLKEALAGEDRAEVQLICNTISGAVAAAFNVPVPRVRVLNVRPLQITETTTYETFGDYDPATARIRLWMRTAVLKRATSFGTFLSTLCHELCHHLDVACLEFPNTYHTRGFYERAALLYHHIQDTPLRNLVWTEQPDGRFRINWAQTMHANKPS